MKITIDLEDFWLDGESDLEKGLKDHVRSTVLMDISKSIKERVESHLTTKIKDEVEKNMYRQMNNYIAEYIKTGTVRSYKNNSIQVTIEEYIQELFMAGSGWGSKSDEIKNLANKFGQEMKNRYDLLFASQLVAKMNETGLLKKEAAKLLLEQK